ncbi:hypothetical protein ABW21_db0200148 [Orbilia brochopaga]|nr:hypothetical protein ABW21_db0200148 [Drechslerella brochopaga]
MAKLSDVHQTPNPALDSLEALKRRYQRQNRELAKTNANQAQQINALQAELSHKNAENLRLNAEVISLLRELDKRDNRPYVGVPESTKRLLENKLSELAGLIGSLHDGMSASDESGRRQSDKRFPPAMKPDLSQRGRPDGILQDIPESETSVQVPNSPILSRPKINDLPLESPAKSYIPLDSAMFDIRPRRRRDSTNVDSLVASTSRIEEQKNSISGTKEPVKRKYPDTTELILAREDIENNIAPPRLSDINEVISSPEPRAADLKTVPQPAERTKELKNSSIEAAPKSSLLRASPSPYKINIVTAPEQITARRRRSLEDPQDVFQEIALEEALLAEAKAKAKARSEAKAQAEARAHAPEPALAAPVEPRRALEPKSTNIVNINNSPVKLPTSADFEYVKKEKLSPRDRDPVKKSARIVAKPIVVHGAENTNTPEKVVERNRRTRGVTVNYALPALNKKLRRESETLVDAVTGIRPQRRSIYSMDTGLGLCDCKDGQCIHPATEEDIRIAEQEVEEVRRCAARLSIHRDALAKAAAAEKNADPKSDTKETVAGSRGSEREVRRLTTERAGRERDPRLEQARKDIYEFTTSNSPDIAEATRRTSGDRTSLTATTTSAASIGGSHQRRTSGGIPTIGIGSKRSIEERASTGSLKSATDLLEERRRRRASLGGTTGTSIPSALASGEAKPRRTVGFADTVRDDSKSSTGTLRETRRRSMIV